MSKRKGSNAERELLNMLWAASWAAIRSAGSGSMHFPSPDILAGNGIRRLAIEAKATKDIKKYFSPEEIKQLINFAQYFGAEPWLAIKFSSSWVFVNPEDLRKTANNLAFFEKDAENKGLSFEKVVNG
ncbi:MAG: Holliday junction resolvase Hjc [Nanoarchaeota archaeon]